MKKLFLFLATLIPLTAVIVGVRLLGEPQREMTDAEVELHIAEVRAAIERKDFEKVRPRVRVTGRTVAKNLNDKAAWSHAMHDVFGDIKVRDASKLRAPCIDAVVEGAKAIGQEWRGLRQLFSDGFAGWERDKDRGKIRYAALPCYAEMVRYEGKLGWLVITNWEWSSWPDTTLGHIALFVVDPKSGELRAYTQCM